MARNPTKPDGGCTFGDLPHKNAVEATVFWHPDYCPLVLRLTARPADLLSDVEAFDLSGIACPATLLVLPDGHQHLLFQQRARCLQLAVSGARLFGAVRLLADAIVDPKDLRVHLKTLECLNDLRVSGQLLARHFPSEPRAGRLRVVLQVLDGWCAGATHREIAVALYGRSRVEADWTDPGNHLRDHVRRALRRGRTLMKGGYRQFLR